MRVTVVGALLIVTIAAASVLLLFALSENQNGLYTQHNGGSEQDQLQHEPDA